MRKVDDGVKRKKRRKKKKKKEKNVVFSGHYVIASSLPPERRCPIDDRCNAARSCQKVNPWMLSYITYYCNLWHPVCFVMLHEIVISETKYTALSIIIIEVFDRLFVVLCYNIIYEPLYVVLCSKAQCKKSQWEKSNQLIKRIRVFDFFWFFD